MSRRKGEITRRRIDRDWPHQVELEVPPNGLGRRLDRLHEIARAITRDAGADYRTRSASAGLYEATRFCFRTRAAAEAFARAEGGNLIE